MKYKTLNDLGIYEEGATTWGCKDGVIDKEELKAEAIKWVKHYGKRKCRGDKHKAEGFKHFFNITEEDLE